MIDQVTRVRIQEAVDLIEKHGSVSAAARASGIPRSTLGDRYRQRAFLNADSQEAKARIEYTDKGLSNIGECINIDENRASGKLRLFILSADPRIQTEAEALAKAQIDTDIWEVDRILIKSYETGCKVESADADGHKTVMGVAVTPLFSITLTLKKIKNEEQFKAFRALVNELKEKPVAIPKITRPKLLAPERHLFEINLADHHFGKLAWGPEVLENYDLDIARDRYLGAMDELLADAKNYPIESILMVMGNDHYHVNNAELTTARGTSQDVDGRWQKVFRVGKIAAVDAIEMARGVAPVEVMIIPGNHDPEWCFFLGEVLAERYRGATDVTVDNRPLLRKYKHYGSSLIGFTHGDKEKMGDLPLVMAQEMKKAWAESTYREVHIGHLHKRSESKFTAGDTWNGVSVRRVPSLCGTDSWHHSHGYTGAVKSSDAYLWHWNNGLRRIFVVNAQDENASGQDAS